MKTRFCFFLFIGAFILTSCGLFSKQRALFSSREHDIVLEATPFKVKGITSESVVDAVEAGFAEAGFDSAIVMFKVDKVLTGELAQVKAGGPSRFQQMKDAIRDRDYWKLIKSDFTDPNELIDQKWLSIAVQDPKKTFGFPSWGTPIEERYKLYLKRDPEQPNSYILVKNQLQS